jgi:hypothetical protein
MKTTLGFLAAIAAPACLLTAWYLWGQFEIFEPRDPYIWIRTRGFFAICVLLSAAHVIVLGIPAYMILRWRNAVRWWSTIASGFVLGAIPLGVVSSWPPGGPPGASANFDGVSTLVNGVPTLAGWLQYFQSIAFFGACGAAAATAFWLTAASPNQSSKRTRVPRAA